MHFYAEPWKSVFPTFVKRRIWYSIFPLFPLALSLEDLREHYSIQKKIKKDYGGKFSLIFCKFSTSFGKNSYKILFYHVVLYQVILKSCLKCMSLSYTLIISLEINRFYFFENNQILKRRIDDEYFIISYNFYQTTILTVQL